MGRFIVTYDISGTARQTFESESLEDAEQMIADKVSDEDFLLDLDEIDAVDFTVKEMFPVTRDGIEIWTTYVLNDDKRGHASAISDTPLFGGSSAQR